jgi:protein phosphatase
MTHWQVQTPSLVLVAGPGAADLRTRCFEPDQLADATDPAGVEACLARPALVALALDDLEPERVDPWLDATKAAHLGVFVLALLPERKGNRQLLGARLNALAKRKVVDGVLAVAADEAGDLTVEQRPLPCDRRELTGPFDLIGDVHGCADELEELLERLGYAPTSAGGWRHPERTVVFLGDLCDRGPRNLDVLRGVMATVEAGDGLCVQGNHDEKLVRVLGGRGRVSRGLRKTLDELEALPEPKRGLLKAATRDFLGGLPSHLVLDDGALVAAHGGIRADMIGRTGSKVSAFTRYGDPTGKTDAHGRPIRRDWAKDYSGAARIVYGHTPNRRPRWVNNTVNIDQGCCFGGRLTALRYPELEFVQVPARAIHFPAPGMDLPS